MRNFGQGEEVRAEDSEMGTISVKIEVGDLQGRHFEEVELEVNPRSTFTARFRLLLGFLSAV